MMTACWFTHLEHGGFPIERAVLGTCDLSVLHVDGEWQWLVRQAGRDIAEGAARTADDARREAIAAAVASNNTVTTDRLTSSGNAMASDHRRTAPPCRTARRNDRRRGDGGAVRLTGAAADRPPDPWL